MMGATPVSRQGVLAAGGWAPSWSLVGSSAPFDPGARARRGELEAGRHPRAHYGLPRFVARGQDRVRIVVVRDHVEIHPHPRATLDHRGHVAVEQRPALLGV